MSESRAWFEPRRVCDDVWALCEPSHVTSWLVVGRERAALIDTGLGLVPLRPLVETLTTLPVVVVTTHHHFDHIGGNREFDEVVAHRSTASLLELGVPRRVLDGYLTGVRGLLEHWPEFAQADAQLLELARPEFALKPLPEEASRWRIPPSQATRVVVAGDRIDLGGRELEVIETPGHSFDSISLVDASAGYLFAGDVVNRGVHYAHLPDASLPDYARTVDALRDVGARVIFANHWPHPIADVRVLAEIAELIERALEGSLATERSVDVVGNRILLGRTRDHSVSLPDPAHPALPLTPLQSELVATGEPPAS